MKPWHCKKCGTFIGHYGYDELCPTCRRKETYLTKDEVVAILEEIQTEIEEYSKRQYSMDECISETGIDIIIQDKIDKLKGNEDENE